MNTDPSYCSGLRLAYIIHELHCRRTPWTTIEISAELDVSLRTAQRYVRILTEKFVDEAGEPMVIAVWGGPKGNLSAIKLTTTARRHTPCLEPLIPLEAATP